MENDANTCERRQAKRSGKSEGVKKGQNTQNAVSLVQMEDLFQLLDVRREIEMRQHHAFGFAGRPAGKNNRRGIVQRRSASHAQKTLQQSRGEKSGGNERSKFLVEPGVF